MISAEALAALGAIEHGARYNIMHTTARELMAAGYASDDWGHLGITEAGRTFLRRGQFRIAITSDDQVCEMSVQQTSIDRTPSKFWTKRAIDPMASPQHVMRNGDVVDGDDDVASTRPLELVPEAPPEPLPIAESRRQEMMRAAGVASGVTGIWPEEKWVIAFIEALDGAVSSQI